MAWFAENLAWASVAMVLVLVIRRPVTHFFGASIAYALWLIPALRLVAPPAEWTALMIDTPLPSLPPLLLFIDQPAAGAAATPVSGSVPWLSILLGVWAAGAALFLLFQWISYGGFLRRLSLTVRSSGSHQGVPLMESSAIEGPLALGLLDRRIVVPADFESRYSMAERGLALDHERHHHRRGDILANHLALIVLALNWFNPVAWIAFRAFRADQELSCDAAVAAAAPPEVRSDYARALVKSASRPGLIAACPLNHAGQLKRRLKMLNHHRKDRRRLWAGSAVTATLIAVSMTLGAPGHAQESGKERTRERRERVIIMEHRDGEGRAHAPGERERERVVIRRGDGEPQLRTRRCEREGGEVINVDEAAEGRRVRLMLCSTGERSSADRLAALQRVRERMAQDDEMPAEVKQRVLAQIDRAIERARGN